MSKIFCKEYKFYFKFYKNDTVEIKKIVYVNSDTNIKSLFVKWSYFCFRMRYFSLSEGSKILKTSLCDFDKIIES